MPIIQQQNGITGAFDRRNPVTTNALNGYFGIGGVWISCIANYDGAEVNFVIAKDNAAQNKTLFDVLYSHKQEIEERLGVHLEWERSDGTKASWMCYRLSGVSIKNEADWPCMAKFHAVWSEKISDVLLQYLQDDSTAPNRLNGKLQEQPAGEEINLLDMIDDMSGLKKTFRQAMCNVYSVAKKECGYNAARFLQMLNTMDSVEVAKQLIHKDGISEGMIALWEKHRLDLSVEAHVIKPEFAPLFTEEEKNICLNRLNQLGYNVADNA